MNGACDINNLALGNNLIVKVTPNGWRGIYPKGVVYMGGRYPVATWYYHRELGTIDGWLTVWGISGSFPVRDITAADVCKIMGWDHD